MTINNIFILLNFELFPKKNMRVSRLVQRCTKFEYAFHTLIQVSYFVWTCTKHDNYDNQYYSRDSEIRSLPIRIYPPSWIKLKSFENQYLRNVLTLLLK